MEHKGSARFGRQDHEPRGFEQEVSVLRVNPRRNREDDGRSDGELDNHGPEADVAVDDRTVFQIAPLSQLLGDIGHDVEDPGDDHRLKNNVETHKDERRRWKILGCRVDSQGNETKDARCRELANLNPRPNIHNDPKHENHHHSREFHGVEVIPKRSLGDKGVRPRPKAHHRPRKKHCPRQRRPHGLFPVRRDHELREPRVCVRCRQAVGTAFDEEARGINRQEIHERRELQAKDPGHLVRPRANGRAVEVSRVNPCGRKDDQAKEGPGRELHRVRNRKL
mmetsp:Transcript_28824/g.72393  ORF Transcript_28824/g.72393 Transcript_28824/m.72393 type:complete len:280 (-) Transcript_28824:398-1237(-)